MTDCPVTGMPVVLLIAGDTEKTAAFYRDILGIPLKGEQHDGRHRHYAARFGGSYLTIQPREDMHAPPSEHGYDYLQPCFSVPDLDPFITSIAGSGVERDLRGSGEVLPVSEPDLPPRLSSGVLPLRLRGQSKAPHPGDVRSRRAARVQEGPVVQVVGGG